MDVEYLGELPDKLLREAKQFNHHAEEYRERAVLWKRAGDSDELLDNPRINTEFENACNGFAGTLQAFAWSFMTGGYLLTHYGVSPDGKALSDDQIRILITDEILGRYQNLSQNQRLDISIGFSG
jgi:hypothetical protein